MAAATHEQWTSKTGFVLAAIGGAVGLGNIWRFPYITGENGGGAFVIIYLIAALAVALPILIGELYIGKKGHKGPVSGTIRVAELVGASRHWQIIGWFGMLAAFLVLTYYAVIAGWALDYVFVTGSGSFSDIPPEAAAAMFDDVLSSPLRMTFWFTVLMLITVFIVARGVTRGIETAVKIMMPAFFVMLAGMLVYAMIEGDFAAGWDFMFTPDFSKITGKTALLAIGQAFFSIGISFGYMLAYGAYLPPDVSIPRTSAIIVLADTAVAIVAGLIIFPLVFAHGLSPDQGADLIFRVLPMAFGQMNFGSFVGAIFFVLLTFAALTSCIAILQPAVAYLEESWGFSVIKATITSAGAAWVIGIGCVLSYNVWAGWYPLNFIGFFEGQTFMGVIDYVTANIMMPVGGILIALFTGWKISAEMTRGEFGEGEDLIHTIWLWLSRVVAPAGVAWIMYTTFFGS